MGISSVSIRSGSSGMEAAVLVATTDAPYAATLVRYMALDGYTLETCHDGQGVLRLVGRRYFDVIVLDLSLGEEGGIDLVSYVRRQSPDSQLILMFDAAHLDRAIDGIRRGAFFYLPASTPPSDVSLVVNKAMRSLQTEAQVQDYERHVFEGLVGGSPAMKRVIDLITKVSPTDSTVLLLGESGTGKDVIANAIHRLSPRKETPFVAVNCAALPEQLLESEMFGHMKGSFTGAEANKRGLFEEADRGTIFLDEIGDMSATTQAKLLRVLQNGEIRPVGSSTPRKVDVRVIAATNRNLEEAVAQRTFREDLYYRLNVIQIRIPPLRERLEALPQLVRHFLGVYGERYGKQIKGFDDHAEALMRNYAYPGNVRELESIIAHAVIMSEDDVIHSRDLPDQVTIGDGAPLALPNYARDAIPTLKDMEDSLIRRALETLDWNQTEVAKRLGVSRSTLWRKMKEYGIEAGRQGL